MTEVATFYVPFVLGKYGRRLETLLKELGYSEE